VLLVTQSLAARAAFVDSDSTVFRQWTPDLDPWTAPAALEQLNDVLRRLARELPTPIADAARDVAWDDADFVDPMHTTGRGSLKLATYLSTPVARTLGETPTPPS
jgi:hypothetical protein